MNASAHVEPQRPTEEQARAAIETFLEKEVPGYPTYGLCEDGDTGWAFWVADEDTTSYLNDELKIQWLGTGWPLYWEYDEETGNWKEKA